MITGRPFDASRPRLLAALILLLAWGSIRAEVAVQLHDGARRDWLIMAIIEDADPVGPRPGFWTRYRDRLGVVVLNPSGAEREDGRPDVHAALLDSDRPLVTWAYNNGVDHDIAFSEWIAGSGWSAIEFLTFGSEDDVDPRVHLAPDGTIYVVWWRPGPPDQVLIASRAPGADAWTTPAVLNSAEYSGRRPAVATHGGAVWVTYERDALDVPPDEGQAAATQTQHQELVVTWRGADGEFRPPQLVIATARLDPLDPMIHSRAGKLWIDWTQGESQCAWTRATPGGWTPPTVEAWNDTSWVGMEQIRLIIQRAVLESD